MRISSRALLFGIWIGANYIGVLLGQPAGVEGYRFAQPAGELTIFW